MNSESKKWKHRELSEGDYDEMLQKSLVGVLCLSDGNRPYAVQLEHLYRDGALYMATSVEGRKMEVLKRNDRAAFIVFQDRHSHPEMIKEGIRCRSVIAEGRVETLLIKEVKTRRGDIHPFRLLKLTIEEKGSWQCNRKACNQASGVDTRKIILKWLQEAGYEASKAE